MSLEYINDLKRSIGEWMSTYGYEGQIWKDRHLKPLDKYEYPQRGTTYLRAYDVAQYLNEIAKGMPGVQLLTGKVHVWVNYGAHERGFAYAPVEAFQTFTKSNWEELYDFALFMASETAGPEFHSAKLAYDMMNSDPALAVSMLSKHGTGIDTILDYQPAGNAAVKVFRDLWTKVVKDDKPN